MKYVQTHPLNSLQGGAATPSDKRLLALIIETNDSGVPDGGSDDELIGVIRGHGFAPFGYDPFGRRLVDVMDASGNTVFIRDKAAVEALVKAAHKYRRVNGAI